MKTIKNLQKEKAEVLETLTTQKLKPAVQSALLKRVQNINTCIQYVETEPSEAYIVSTIARLEKEVSEKMKQIDLVDMSEMAKPDASYLKKSMEKERNIPHLREQLATLYYILNSD